MGDRNIRRVQRIIRAYSVSGLLLTGFIIALVILIPFQARLFNMQKQHLMFSRNVAVLVLDSCFQRTREIAKQISTRMNGRHIVMDYENGVITKKQAENALQEVFKNSLAAYPDLVSITRFDKNAHVILSAGVPVFTTNEMKKLIKDKLFIYEPHRQKKINQHYLLSMSVIHNYENKQIGYDVFTFQLMSLENTIREKLDTQLGTTYIFYVRNDQLHWLLSSDKNSLPEAFLKDESLKSTLISSIKKNKSGIFSENYNKKGAIVTYAPVPNMPWGVVVYADKAHLYHSVQHIILILLSIVALILLLFALGLSAVLRPLSNRLLLRADELADLVQAGKAELKILNEKLYNLAMYDSLTNLMTRRAFYERVDEEISRCKRFNRGFTLFYIDVDHFKLVNDTIGHHGGDYLLKKIAEHLLASVRKEDLVARLGGDEFAILLTEKTDDESSNEVFKRVKSLEKSPVFFEQHKISVTLSIGTSVYPKEGGDVDELLRAADQQMYRDKSQSKR